MSSTDQPPPEADISDVLAAMKLEPLPEAVARKLNAQPPAAPARGLHYGWWIVLSALLSVFISLGVGRFALGMLLPAMAENLALDYVQMGWISTANFIGYLLGALWVRQLLPRYGERVLISGALLVIIATMVGISVAAGFMTLLILYIGTGLGSGVAFVSAVALVPHWFVSRWRGRAVGFLSAGAGLAVILSGWAIPLINGALGPPGWRLGWAALAAVCLPLAIFCMLVLRSRPAEMNLEPFGGNGETAQRPAPPAPGAGVTETAAGRAMRDLIIRLGTVYFLFGMTYVVYLTFVVTTLVREHGMAEARAGQFWIWMGVFTLICGPLMGALSDRLGRRAGIAMAFLLQGCAYALIAQGSGNAVIYLSVALFGLSAFGVPLIITAAVADYLTPGRAVGVIGAITVIFGLGQMLGPVLAGLMAEYSGSFTPAYLAATSLVALAIAITLTLPHPPE